MEILFWIVVAVAGLAATFAALWIILVIAAIVGYELGLTGPPFGGE